MENEEIFNKGLPDVQSSDDHRHIPIDRVGIRGLTMPMAVESQDGIQHTVATIAMMVSLEAEHRGTHMSRFISLLNGNLKPLSEPVVQGLLRDMLELLEAKEGYIDIRFPFFVTKESPVSKLKSTMNYDVHYIAEKKNGVTTVEQEIIAPVTSLCPCSKEISRYGAHNQRSLVTISVELNGHMSLEEQIRIAENSASCPLWSRLKRADEKFVTEFAYDHPKFVEDIVRDAAHQLNDEPRIVRYRVEAENFESIHNHQAYAQICRDKRTNPV